MPWNGKTGSEKELTDMKRSHIIIINAIFISLMLFSAGTVYQFMTGNKPLAILHNIGHHNAPSSISTNRCSSISPISGLNRAQNTSLKKLGIYQEACHSFVTNTVMIFVGMPVSDQSASQNAEANSATLKEFAKFGVRPL